MPRLARAIEGLFGPSLAAAAEALTALATILLVAGIAIPLLHAVLSYHAWRHGWETARVVRCRRCGRLAADPEAPVCPSGHPVRFPPGAARLEALKRRFPGWRSTAAAYPMLFSLLVCALAVGGYATLRVGRLDSPLASMAAALSYVFFAALLYAASYALSPRWRGWTTRVFHTALAAALLLPVFLFASLSRGLEPPEREVLAHFWTTPTAVYLSSGGRAKKVAPAAAEVTAVAVEAHLPAVGVVWEGLQGFRIGEEEIAWKGSGGRMARWLAPWAADSSPARDVALLRSARRVPLSPNLKIEIVKERGRLRFTPAG